MSSTLSLAQMVDLALGTPDVGAVNFNVLHTLLHAVLHKLDISDTQAKIDEADKELLSKQNDENVSPNETNDNKDSDTAETQKSPQESPPSKSKSAPLHHNKSPYHQLQRKVSDIEKQLDALNSLPTNDELFGRASGISAEAPGTDKRRPVSDMWQQMQLAKKVDANEEGISKLMSLVEDMMGEVNELKGLKDLKDEMKALKDMYDNISQQMDDLKDLSDINSRLKELENMMNDLNKQMSELPNKDDLTNLVTWESLENALKGIKDDLQPQERVVIEMSSQTEEKIPSRPASRASRGPSRMSTPGPSAEMMDLLERLGTLTDKHDKLEERVDIVEEELKNKADKEALDGISVPDDLLEQLKSMQEDLDRMKKNREKDSDALSRMQQAILNLQAELERLSNTTQEILDENNNKAKQIKALYDITTTLEEVKADKEFVHNEVEVKADKRHLDNKVNRSTFDSTCDELNKMINDILEKITGHESDWQKALAQLTNDLDGKLDRLEFGPFRDELEKQLKALKAKLKGLDLSGLFGDGDDAAGLRKQMMKFNCISCDRPVDMAPQGPIPSIPTQSGLPATKSARPYTTFELDQIRQHARSFPNPNLEVMDLYATNRSCGGSHTLTYPHKRITRVTHMKDTSLPTLFRDDETSPQPGKDELDIQGADGHVYKGRMDRLPTVLGIQGSVPPDRSISPQPPRRGITSMERSRPRTPRGSARLTNRPQSARGEVPMEDQSVRPQSAGGRPTPSEDGLVRMPPAPAPSEPDNQEPALQISTPTINVQN